MIRENELKGIMTAQGYTQKKLAEKLDMTPETFRRKLNKGVFGSDEIEKMIEILKIEDPMWIFFNRKRS